MNPERQMNKGIRIGSMLIDHIAMTFIAMIFFLPGMISEFSNIFEVNHDQNSSNIFGGMIYFLIIGMALYFCKDCINGRSIAKRVLKLQVVDNKTDKAVTPLKSVLRNIFIIIWPIEVIVTLINPNRRIGDLVAGTKVIPFNSEIEQRKLNFIQIGFAFILAYGLMILIMLPFGGIKSKMENNRIEYVDSSLNEQSANATMELFSDKLGNLLNADIKVYDQIKGYENLKYVSVILFLNENYLENEQDFEKIKSKTIPLLLTMFPEKTFVGQVKYVYKEPNSMMTRTIPLDWRYNGL